MPTASEVASEAISKARQVTFCPTGNCMVSGLASKMGAEDYGIVYVNGLAVMQGVRENSEMVVEAKDLFDSIQAFEKTCGHVPFKAMIIRNGKRLTGLATWKA